jgi:hypothetical protein
MCVQERPTTAPDAAGRRHATSTLPTGQRESPNLASSESAAAAASGARSKANSAASGADGEAAAEPAGAGGADSGKTISDAAGLSLAGSAAEQLPLANDAGDAGAAPGASGALGTVVDVSLTGSTLRIHRGPNDKTVVVPLEWAWVEGVGEVTFNVDTPEWRYRFAARNNQDKEMWVADVEEAIRAHLRDCAREDAADDRLRDRYRLVLGFGFWVLGFF